MGGVEQVWYRLPNEDISVARCIYKDKENEIRKMCSEVAEVGEVYVYIEHVVSSPVLGIDVSSPVLGISSPIEAHVDGGDDDNEREDEEEKEEVYDSELAPEENNDEEVVDVENREAESGDKNGNIGEEPLNQPSKDEAEMVGEGVVDARFDNFFVNAEEEARTRYGATPPVVCGEVSSDSENEEVNGIDAGEYPGSLVDTDEEWANFNKKDDKCRCRKGKRDVADYDKPPYLWLMQEFKNGDEFKDQLLRYVLKTQYDVKLNRWESTKQAAICTDPKCYWRIYCLVEKPIRKWMVKAYEDKQDHIPTGRARMLKQGTIAKLFKEEARRRHDIKCTC